MRINSPLFLEKIVAPSGQLFALRRSRPPFFPFRWHYHPEVELTLIRRGRGLRYVGHSVEPYEAGDLCLLGSGLPHSWSSDRGAARVESTVIQFLPDSGGKAFWQLRELGGVVRLLDRAKQGLVVEDPLRGEAIKRIDTLEKLPLTSPVRVSLFLDLLAGLNSERGLRTLHPAAAAHVPRSGSGEARLQKILRFVEVNSAQTIVHADLARQVGLSAPAFCRFFMRQMGKTFSAHVNDVRVARACAALADTDKAIIDIALDCGYNNLPYFNRRFLALMNCTPRDYRRRVTRGEAGPV